MSGYTGQLLIGDLEQTPYSDKPILGAKEQQYLTDRHVHEIAQDGFAGIARQFELDLGSREQVPAAWIDNNKEQMIKTTSNSRMQFMIKVFYKYLK